MDMSCLQDNGQMSKLGLDANKLKDSLEDVIDILPMRSYKPKILCPAVAVNHYGLNKSILLYKTKFSK